MRVDHTIRGLKGDIKVKLTYKSAIHAFCRECMGWEKGAPSECTSRKCALWPFRPGGDTGDGSKRPVPTHLIGFQEARRAAKAKVMAAGMVP